MRVSDTTNLGHPAWYQAVCEALNALDSWEVSLPLEHALRLAWTAAELALEAEEHDAEVDHPEVLARWLVGRTEYTDLDAKDLDLVSDMARAALESIRTTG